MATQQEFVDAPFFGPRVAVIPIVPKDIDPLIEILSSEAVHHFWESGKQV